MPPCSSSGNVPTALGAVEASDRVIRLVLPTQWDLACRISVSLHRSVRISQPYFKDVLLASVAFAAGPASEGLLFRM